MSCHFLNQWSNWQGPICTLDAVLVILSTDLKNTLGVIYIVRDPRNVVTSYAHHYNLNINEATDALLDKSSFLVKTDKNCKAFMGSWDFNYNSWKKFETKKKYLLIKYEDLVNKKKKYSFENF